MVGDLEGLVGDGVALRLGRVVTVRPLFGVFPPPRRPRSAAIGYRKSPGRSAPAGQSASPDQTGAKCHEELQPLSDRQQGGGGDPGVLAPPSGGREHRLETVVLGRPGDLREVIKVRESLPRLRTGAVASTHDGTRIAAGRKEPVQRHIGSLLSALSSFNGIGISSNFDSHSTE